LIFFFIFYADYAEGDIDDGSFRVFTYNQLKSATNNFDHKIGQGGFGSVYKVIYYILMKISLLVVMNL